MADLAWRRLYCCYKCQNHICCHDDILNKYYQTRSGSRAFLFAHAINVVQGPKEDRQLITGRYTVAEVHCSDCKVVLGCKYVKAYDELHKYKEGKYCIAMFNIVKANW